MTDTIPLTPAMLVSDFVDDWLHEPEDLEVFVGIKDEVDLDTPKALGDELLRTAIDLIEQEQDNYPITGAYYTGRAIGIALAMARRVLETIDPEALGRELWQEYTGEEAPHE